MKVNCVYRWALDGEIIQSLFDTDTLTIDGVDPKYFQMPAGCVKYHSGNTQLYGSVPYAELNRTINRLPKVHAVIDYDCIGLMTIVQGWACRWLFINEDLDDIHIGEVFSKNILQVGFAKTIIRQRSVLTKPQKLYYSFEDKALLTADGKLPIDFDVNEISPIKTFDKYVEMVDDVNAIGVANFGGVNHKLVLCPDGIVRKE